jgi:competence ComEA-like helix-hairpin-helix protein
MPYTRPQILVLLVVVLVAGLGLAVGQWRRAHPELAARLEAFDRVPAPPTPTVDELPVARPARRAATPKPPAPPKLVAPERPLDVNRASEEELRALPGIGAVLAARIVEARERDGPFASLDDVRRVRGLGRAKLDKLTAAIAVGL